MTRVALLVVVGLAGCDYVFQLHDAVRTDAAPDAPACIPSEPRDAFMAAMPCTPWGHVTAGGTGTTLVEQGGTLTATILQSGQIAGCMSNALVPIDARGVFVAVDRVLVTVDAYTSLMLEGESAAWRYSVDESNGKLEMTLDSVTRVQAISYAPTTMRFWRIRLAPQTDEIVTEYGADAVLWTELGRAPAPATKQAYLRVLAGLHPAAPVPDMAVFSHLDDCP